MYIHIYIHMSLYISIKAIQRKDVTHILQEEDYSRINIYIYMTIYMCICIYRNV
jgi:hypothetical protein